MYEIYTLFLTKNLTHKSKDFKQVEISQISDTVKHWNPNYGLSTCLQFVDVQISDDKPDVQPDGPVHRVSGSL